MDMIVDRPLATIVSLLIMIGKLLLML